MTIIVTMKDGKKLTFKDALHGYEGPDPGTANLSIRHETSIGTGKNAAGQDVPLWRFLAVMNRDSWRDIEFKEDK